MFPKTIEELNRIRQECLLLVNRRATASAVAAIIPVPGADVTADIAILLQLLTLINRKFGLSPSYLEKLDSVTKAKIFYIIASIGCKFAGRIITKELIVKLLRMIGVNVTVKQAAKFVPLLGQTVSAGISFGAMKYLGKLHIEECYSVCIRILDMQQEMKTFNY